MVNTTQDTAQDTAQNQKIEYTSRTSHPYACPICHSYPCVCKEWERGEWGYRSHSESIMN